MMQPKLTVLDCTLRDGGYYNNWDFSQELVARYLNAMDAAGVDVVEIGFRFPPQGRFLGPYAYSTDRFLERLPRLNRSRLAVMINGKDFTDPQQVHGSFAPAPESPVGIVRVAIESRAYASVRPALEQLAKLGYRLCLNLMQVTGLPLAEVNRIAREVAAWGYVETLYLADSFGNLRPDYAGELFGVLRANWQGGLGIHAHDNMGLALPNTLAAVDAGANWMDVTVLGMGRGAGNARLEHLLVELQRRGVGPYNLDPVFPLVVEDFEQLRRQHGWGMNLLYYLAATYDIHPTYFQEILNRGHYESHHIMSALDVFRINGASAYSESHLNTVMSTGGTSATGSWCATEWAKGRTMLLVGPGQGAVQHLDALCDYVDRHQPVVVSLNTNQAFPAEKISAYAACHRTRILMDVEKYRALGKPLITPAGSLPEGARDCLAGVELLDYGMHISPDVFRADPSDCTIPGQLVAAYVLALASASGASRVLLAGFDGYGSGDPRQREMTNIFALYAQQPNAVPLLAVTPTTYDVPKGSIYAPGI